MNPIQVRHAESNTPPPEFHDKKRLSVGVNAAALHGRAASQSSGGLSACNIVEIDLPGIQRAAAWPVHYWAKFVFDALNHHARNIRFRVFPALTSDRALIELSDALELAHSFTHQAGESFAQNLSIASPCLAQHNEYTWHEAFIHCCFALHNAREVLLAELFQQFAQDKAGDVLLAETLAIAEQVLHYEGTITEHSATNHARPTRLQALATRARAIYILATFTEPLEAACTQEAESAGRAAAEQGREVPA